MIQPHSSSKYAVVFNPIVGGYMVAAVHGLETDGTFVLGSIQFPVGDTHVYHPPVLIPGDDIKAMAQTTEAAWKYKRHLEDQDREGDRR